jgi:hypothetical protein
MIHKHAAEIIAWAGGEEIQTYRPFTEEWIDTPNPSWLECTKYRIKPEPKPDVVMQFHAVNYQVYSAMYFDRIPNLKLTFDVETCELKAAEVLK